jgi:hypothetical protein
MSLNPDTVFKTTERILQVEKELKVPRRTESDKKKLAAN